MLNLERLERAIIIFLLFTLLLGAGIMVFKRSCASVNVEVGRFTAGGKTTGKNAAENPPGIKDRININEAGAGELMKLKGVGKVLAHRIVDHRSSRGHFLFKEDIRKVRGIGPALFEKIKDDIAVE